MRVRDVMTKDPVTIHPDEPLRRATELMRGRGIRHLPVTDEGGRVLGILTDRDLRHAAFLPALAEQLGWEPRRLGSPRVRDVMTWSAVTIDAEASLAQAGLTMFERRIGSLPVTSEGRLAGILTEKDVLEALGREGRALDAGLDFW